MSCSGVVLEDLNVATLLGESEAPADTVEDNLVMSTIAEELGLDPLSFDRPAILLGKLG